MNAREQQLNERDVRRGVPEQNPVNIINCR